MQRRGGRRAARQHEGAQGRQLGVQLVDLVLQALDLGLADAQAFALRLALAFGRGEIGAEIEQIVLDPRQHGIDAAAQR